MVPPLPDADCLLIVPPLAHVTWPSLAVHQLQACARSRGHRVAVLYANIAFAARIGAVRYSGLANAPDGWMLGERLFARAAFGGPALGRGHDVLERSLAHHNASCRRLATSYLDQLSDASGVPWDGTDTRYELDELYVDEQAATALVADLAAAIGARYRVVGATTTFDQTSASIALLAAVKAAHPEVTTIVGGANCDGAMAEAVAALSPLVDHVFRGESDWAFPEFLEHGTSERVVAGAVVRDLDALPTVDFAEYWAQLAGGLPELQAPTWISYESSRGCWWGAKQHCTFCGLNGAGMAFRDKSADRVLAELRTLLEAAPTHRVAVTDNIMPHRQHAQLVPRLPAELPGVRLFSEQKANLRLHQVRALHEAGVATIQPGIEALSTPLLKRMAKGVSARQNIALLRYASSVGMRTKWNLLFGFPGDAAEDYAHYPALAGLLCHLAPPQAFAPISIDRFSPYHDHPEEHGITELRPHPGYGQVFPEGTDTDALAYHFLGRFPSGSLESPELVARVHAGVDRWRELWHAPDRPRPVLRVTGSAGHTYALQDTRGLGLPEAQLLTEAQAHAALVGGPLARVPLADWAVRAGVAVALDGWCVPLAVAAPDLLERLEAAPLRPQGIQTLTL